MEVGDETCWPPPKPGEPAAERPKGKRKPWIPPRFERVDLGMEDVADGHTYFDQDDSSSPGGRAVNADTTDITSMGVDQTNPYNS